MQWNRVKTLLIVLLLIVNGVLGGNILGNAVQKQLMRHETAQNAMAVLEERGIQCSEDVFSQKAHQLSAAKILLDEQEMHQFALSFFQGDFQEKRDGEQITLTTEEKSISFDVNGVFSGTIKEELPLSIEEAERNVKSWMKSQNGDYQLDSTEKGGNYTVRVYRVIDKVRLEEPLQFLFLVDGTVSLSGRWTFGTLTETGDYDDCRDTVAGSLLRFLDQAGQVQRIDSARACYCLLSGSGKSLQIEPGWHWKTDIGAYLTSSESDFLIFKQER